MKKILFFVAVKLLLMASCSHEETAINEPVYQEISLGTRSTEIDSVIANSKLLNEIRAFNDSVMNLHSLVPQTRSDTASSPTLNITPITIADALGWASGFFQARKDGVDVAMIVATMSSAQASNKVAKEFSKTNNNPFQVAETNSFKQYENCLSAAIHDPQYSQNYDLQLAALGDLSQFTKFKHYFRAGVDHNLILERYNREEFLGNANTVALFSPQVNSIIYSPDYQAEQTSLINDIVNDQVNYAKLFYNHDNLTQTYSQYIAGEFLKAYVHILTHHQATLESVKGVTLEYLYRTNGSTELSDYEKNILLNTLPIGITSFKYWESNLASK